MQSTINDIQLPKELQEKRGVDMTGEDFLIIMMEVMKINPSPMIPQKPTYLRGKKHWQIILNAQSLLLADGWIVT